MDTLEKIVRPIVEGQIRGFLKEHPSIAEAVDWYKPRRDDKVTTFINSLSKRIVRDLTCPNTRARLVAALLENVTDTPCKSRWHVHLWRRVVGLAFKLSRPLPLRALDR